jgi:hypothetical protein
VALGYSASATTIIRGANDYQRVRLSRVAGWNFSNPIQQNIAVACKVGWHLDTGVLIVPPDVQRLVIKVAWKMFNTAGTTGIASLNKAGTATSFIDDLSPSERDTLDWLRGI